MTHPLRFDSHYADLLRAQYRTTQAAHYAAFLKTQDALAERRMSPELRVQWEQARLDLAEVRRRMAVFAEGTQCLSS